MILRRGGGSSIARTGLLIAAGLLLLGVKLYCYPHPYLATDSSQYIDSAVHLKNNVYRPIGYSLFLGLLTGSDGPRPVERP
jgi:hypothetical protein